MTRIILYQPCRDAQVDANRGRSITGFFGFYGPACLCAAIAYMMWLPPALSQSLSAGSPSYFRFNDVQEMIANWKPNQHLYVKGNLRPSSAELTELEQWLHKHGHWTVVLMEHAQDQRYTNADGRVEIAMDAVELSISDLMEVGSYRRQANPITGQQDAAIFVIFLQERKFSYRAADAFTERGLGQNRWIGKLDRPAYRAMRGGGRIIDAVKDTVKSINTPLRNAIKQEQERAQEIARKRKRSLEEISAQINQVSQKLARVETYAKEVRAMNPAATADLTAPEIANIQTELAELKQTLTAPDAVTAELRSQVDQISNVSDDWINLYNEYARFEDSETQLKQRRDQLQQNAADLQPAINDEMVNVNQLLGSARDSWEAAESQFLKHLNAADHALENATQQLAQQRQTRAQSSARRSFIGRVTLAVTGFLSTLLAGFMFWLNRSRRPAKTRAVKRLNQRTDEVKKEMEGMEDLLDRANMVIGDRKAIERKGYQGATKDLSNKALDDIDDLLVMSNSVEKVMDEAREKITPDSWWQGFKNRWSARRYDDGYEILESRPITFDQSDGIALVGDEADGAMKTETQTNSDGQQEKTIQLSFAQLFQIFRKRSQRAQDTISNVETGWTKIVATNNELQLIIDTASTLEQHARTLTEQDSLLNVPQIFDELLKSAQADQDASEALGKHDPISAIAGPAGDGLRKATDANELSRHLVEMRDVMLPTIRANAQALDQRGRAVQWIDVALDDFTQRAQSLASTAIEQSVAEEVALWRQSFEQFTAATTKAVQLHDRSTGDVAESITSAASEVAAARTRIAAELDLQPDQVLKERGANADEQCVSATHHNLAAQSALDRGDPPAAALSIAQSQQSIAAARATASDSLKILDDLRAQTGELDQRLDDTEKRLSAGQTTLQQLQTQFSDSALMIETTVPAVDMQNVDDRTTDGQYVSEVTIYESVNVPAFRLLDSARRQLETAATSNQTALTLYAQGHLLAADDSYDSAVSLQKTADDNLNLLSEHARLLNQKVADNSHAVEQLQTQLSTLAATLTQHHVTRATSETAQRMQSDLDALGRSIRTTTGRCDPDADADQVQNTGERFERLNLLLKVDRDTYEEASRSLESLSTLLERARTTAVRSQRDNIPDSGPIRTALLGLDDAARRANDLKTQIRSPHGDWQSIDEQSDAAFASVTRSLARLQSELKVAQTAAAAIDRASSQYRSAANWSGDYGIRANPQTVRHLLDQSRDALAQGDYRGALALAERSNGAVANAIAIAQNEVLRRRAAQRRAQEERRRRHNRSIGGGSIMTPSGFPDFGSSRARRQSTRRSAPAPRRSSSSTGRGGFSRSGW